MAATEPERRGSGEPDAEGRVDAPDAILAGGPSPEVPLLSNAELAAIFHEIGDMLEVQGELVFKTVAYHRAADAIAHSPVEVARAYREGHPPRIPGVGAAISKKLLELATTGRLAFHERLRAEVPPSLVALLEIPGVGPRTVKLLHEQRGIETLDDLRRAAEAGHLRDLRGMSERTEAAILDGIAQLERRQQRMRLGEAERIVEGIVAELRDTPGVHALVPAGSFRRRRETVGDLDLLASTDDPGALVGRFVGLPSVDRVLGSGPHKASVRLRRRPAGRPDGDAARRGGDLPRPLHRVEGAQRAAPLPRPRPGLEPVREGLPAPRTGWRAAHRRRCGAAHVRHGGGGVRVPRPGMDPARAARGPRRDRGGRRRAGCRGWSSRPTCAATATATPTGRTACTRSSRWRRRPGHAGYAYQGLTDHSFGLAIARGLTPERVLEQRARSSPRSTSDSRGRRTRAGRLPQRPPRASACCTGASWRSGRTRRSTSPMRSWRGSTWWWPRCTSRGGNRGSSSWRGSWRPCAARTSTSSRTPRAG